MFQPPEEHPSSSISASGSGSSAFFRLLGKLGVDQDEGEDRGLRALPGSRARDRRSDRAF